MDPLSGLVYGKYDPQFVGHAPACPVVLFADVHTAADVADQAAVLAAWWYAAGHLEGSADVWRVMAWSLMHRAGMLGLAWPVPDDARELERVP